MKKQLLKILLSLFVVYHVLAVVVLSNGGSYLGRSWQSYLLPYANNLGLNATWSFFAPDPAHTMYFEYVIEYADGRESSRGFFPPERQAFVNDTSARRLLYAMRYLILDPQKMDILLIPWLCRSHPDADRVFIKHLIQKIPSLDLAVLRMGESVESLREEIKTTQSESSCQRGTP